MYSDFQNGWFGIKGTGKSSFSTSTDLTLEQTIHAHTCSQRFGIKSMTCKTNLGRASFFFNYNCIVVVRYARPKEKRRCPSISDIELQTFCIAAGKAVYLYTEEVLLTINVSKCRKRLSKCIKRPERFEERISKEKM